jgi:hypothetical protein
MFLIPRFDRHFSRRTFLENTAKGLLRAGVFGSAWSIFAKTGSLAAAYPDELTSVEVYTKGKIKDWDTIDASNVDYVKDLVDGVRYRHIKEMGRKMVVVPTTTDLTRLAPPEYIEATLRNRGKGTFDAKGNVMTTDGQLWIGGNPFPEPKTAMEIFAGHTLSWGRHDASVYAVKEYDLDDKGRLLYDYSIAWAEMATAGRITLDPKPYMHSNEDKLRYQAVYWSQPEDVKGLGFLNIWHYDQSQFPELIGYLPQFKRVRKFPTNERFETLNPGNELYLSDAWAAGDPYLTWGNYQLVGRKPMLAGVSRGWSSQSDNWHHATHGGPEGNLFWDTFVEMVPETLIVEANPTGYPRAPVSKKQVWFDARTLLPQVMVSYDRRGAMFRSFEGAYSVYDDGKGRVMDGDHPYWSWCVVHAFNLQTSHMTRLEQVQEIPGGHRMRVNDPEIYDKYLTRTALESLGSG